MPGSWGSLFQQSRQQQQPVEGINSEATLNSPTYEWQELNDKADSWRAYHPFASHFLNHVSTYHHERAHVHTMIHTVFTPSISEQYLSTSTYKRTPNWSVHVPVIQFTVSTGMPYAVRPIKPLTSPSFVIYPICIYDTYVLCLEYQIYRKYPTGSILRTDVSKFNVDVIDLVHKALWRYDIKPLDVRSSIHGGLGKSTLVPIVLFFLCTVVLCSTKCLDLTPKCTFCVKNSNFQIPTWSSDSNTVV